MDKKFITSHFPKAKLTNYDPIVATNDSAHKNVDTQKSTANIQTTAESAQCSLPQSILNKIPYNSNNDVKIQDDQEVEDNNAHLYQNVSHPKSLTESKSSGQLKIDASTSYIEKVKHLETMISTIKENAFDRIKMEYEEKMKQKRTLESNVTLFTNSIKALRLQRRAYGSKNAVMINENIRLLSSGDRAVRATYFLGKEMPDIKVEIEQMNALISQKNEETNYLRNDTSAVEREILQVKDEIKKMNKKNTDLQKEKETLKCAISLLNRHILQIREKIEKQENECNEFLNNVSILAESSKASSKYQSKIL